MNSKVRRQERREEERAKHRTYNYEQVVDLMHKIIKKTENNYCAKYSLILANALNAPPFNFGKKRICTFLELFYEQIKGMQDKTIEYELIQETASKLGVHITEDNTVYTITIDGRTKKQKETEPIKTFFIGGK